MKPRTRMQCSLFVGARLAALCAVGVVFASGCGGGSGPVPPPGPPSAPPVQEPPPVSPPPVSPPPVSPPPVSPPPVATPEEAILRLYESVAVHEALAASPFVFTLYPDDTVWTDWSCYRLSLNGQPPSPGTVLPTGRNDYAVTFTKCPVDLLVGTTLDGTASAAYTSADLRQETTALLSVHSMRGTLVALRSDLFDATADGSGTWTRVRTGEAWSTSATETWTYAPTVGSTLVNNVTGNAATFGGGSYSSGYGPVPPGSASAGHEEFHDLVVAVGGASYTLKGSLHSVYAFSAEQTSHSGEIQITSNGSLVARVYGDGSWKLRTESLSPVNPL